MKPLISIFLIFIFIACSENPNMSENDDIFSGVFNQLYEGTISYNISGDFEGNYQNDSSFATLITDEGGGLSIFLQDQSFNISFIGLISSSNLNLVFTDTTNVSLGEVYGVLFNDSLFASSKSGDFVFTSLDKSEMKGHFNGLYKDTNKTVTLNGTFELKAVSIILPQQVASPVQTFAIKKGAFNKQIKHLVFKF
jgi:hypothetical protein